MTTLLPRHLLLTDWPSPLLAAANASPNWFAGLELYCSPVPRERHGKSGGIAARHVARKYKRRQS